MKLVLSSICVVLSVLFAYQVMSYPLDPEDGKNLDSNISQSIYYDLPQLAVLNSIDEYSEIVVRPLFAKDRAPVVGVKALNKVTTVNELAHLVLVGTVKSSDVQMGIVADTKAKEMERLKLGESYHDWKIAEVSTDYILFQNEQLEYKLFVTPIEGSTKAKQTKFITQLNKNKIESAKAVIRTYQADNIKAENTATDRSVKGRSWGYNKKYNKSKENQSAPNNQKAQTKKSIKRSPIKIPVEEDERDAAYYEGLDDGNPKVGSSGRDAAKREIDAEDYYDDENITEDELKALESLGAQIFDE